MKWIRCQIIWNRTLPEICRFADLADLKLNDIYLIFDFFHWISPFGYWANHRTVLDSRCIVYTIRVKNVFAITFGYIMIHSVTVWAIIRLGCFLEMNIDTRTDMANDRSKPHPVISSTRTVQEKTSPAVRRCKACSSDELQLNCVYARYLMA